MHLHSVAALRDDEWVVRSEDITTVETHGAWLDDTLARHRSDLGVGPDAQVDYRFEIGGRSTTARIASVQDASNRARALRNEARELESTVADERQELVDELTDLRVAPTEIAEILGLSVRTVRAELGSDEEARIARRIMRTLRTTR
jgi:hypothetical protein